MGSADLNQKESGFDIMEFGVMHLTVIRPTSGHYNNINRYRVNYTQLSC